MIGMKLEQAKAGFFDRATVIGATDQATRRVLSKFGAFVRQRAKTSIRKKKGSSPPGTPPHSHVGLLRKFILFTYDHPKRSVVIGPTRLNSPSRMGGKLATELLEHGGVVKHGGRILRYLARPFMRPALAAEMAKMPGMFRNQVRSRAA